MLLTATHTKKTSLSLIRILLGSCAIALLAQIKIPLYFTPVPLTLQTLGVMLVGAFLGPKEGFLATLLYLFQGALGLPVLAGGSFGLIHFMGPTGGYLLAFPLQAFIIGALRERQMPLFPSLLISCCVQLALGSLFLASFVGLKNCFTLGFFPFVLGEIMKAGIVACLIKDKPKNGE